MTKITEIHPKGTEDPGIRAIIPAPGAEESLHSALHINTHFGSQAQYGGADTTMARRLTWLTGNNDCFAANGKTPLPAARGWYIDKPDDDELYPDDFALLDAMEALVEQGLAAECVVSHPDETGKPRKVPSWHLPVASLFVVCQGIPSKSEMLNDPGARWGVAFAGWQTGGVKSTLIFSCFVKELMDAGYSGPFTARFSSYTTDKALSCLKAQEYILKFVDTLRNKAGEAEPIAYYAYALPITCSSKTITAGKEVGKTREVYYPVPAIPRLSQRDPEAALAYLASHAITEDQAFVLEHDGRVERTIEWSVKTSQRLTAGEVIEDPGMVNLSDNEAPF